MEPVCTCACGNSYTEPEWAALPLAGFQQAENPDNLLELRQCHCGSHRALEVMGPGAWFDLAIRRLTEARVEAQAELPSLSRSYAERALTCTKQAFELLNILAAQQARHSNPVSVHQAMAAE